MNSSRVSVSRTFQAVQPLFSELRFVVIYEAHTFMADERRRQGLCLLERLERVARVPPCQLGLSATSTWRRPGCRATPRGVQVITDTSGERRIYLALEHYTERRDLRPVATGDTTEGDLDTNAELLEATLELYNALCEHSLSKKSLMLRGLIPVPLDPGRVRYASVRAQRVSAS